MLDDHRTRFRKALADYHAKPSPDNLERLEGVVDFIVDQRERPLRRELKRLADLLVEMDGE